MLIRVELAGRLSLLAGERWMDTARLGRNDRLAFAYLMHERSRQVSRSELAELVWEANLPATWKTALRGMISRIRGALATAGLPAGTLHTGSGWYEMSLPEQTTVDVESAESSLASAVDLLAQGHTGLARAAAEKALAVARQPFLAGVHAGWVEQRQERLDDLRLQALEVITDAALHSSDWATARRCAEQAITMAPLRESAYRRLALMHAGCGDRGEALRILAQCRRTLAEELGADVSPETEAMSVRLLRGTPWPALFPATSDAARRPDRPRLARPGQPTGVPIESWVDTSNTFVGRVTELAQLRAAWQRAVEGSPE
ncbi:MAG TPA: BTAD domain-containing putative transcriptional regulator, partial [Micromonosporaceae bacterium]